MFLHADRKGSDCANLRIPKSCGPLPRYAAYGFGNDNANNLRLWDSEIPEEHELDYPTIEGRRRCKISPVIQTTGYEGKELRLDPGIRD